MSRCCVVFVMAVAVALVSFMLHRIASHTFFFFNDTATTEIYPLSLHDALPISRRRRGDSRPHPLLLQVHRGQRGVRGPHGPPLRQGVEPQRAPALRRVGRDQPVQLPRSEEHTSELQSRSDLVCRLLLEKKKLTLLQINDVYSTVPIEGLGGLARVATIKRTIAAAGRAPLLLLAGDFLSPSVASSVFKGD